MLVKIKTWEALEKEFGTYRECIECSYLLPFPKSINDMLPENRIIELEDRPNKNNYLHYSWKAPNGNVYACFEKGLIEEVISGTEYEVSRYNAWLKMKNYFKSKKI